MPSQPNRLLNGVKRRIDGQGDKWALEHRDRLGHEFLMHDLDAVFGNICFGHNTGEKLFLEYTPDNYQNHISKIRRFGIIALFDRKTTKDAALHSRNILSTAFYLFICRVFALYQPFFPKFYYVIGKDVPPWSMIELDIKTGEPKNEIILNSVNWRKIWQEIGLTELRKQLELWINADGE